MGAGGTRPWFTHAAACALVATAWIAGATRAPGEDDASPERPNVVLITADTLRADHLSAYGYDGITTPTIDRLAAISVRFDRAMTPFPRTTPALGSLMTGLWPQRHGSREVGEPVLNGTTLAEVLAEHGYATFGVSANWVAGREQNLHRGFRGFVSLEHHKVDDRGELVTQRLLEMARLAKSEEPLFVWAHYMDPHFPYRPPKSRDTPDAADCRKLMHAMSKQKLPLGPVQGNRLGLGEQSVADCTALYDAEIAYMDWQIGKLLMGLERLGRLANVVLVFTADHGEALGDGGLYYEHGTTLHDAVMRVPLLITAPGVEPGVDSELIRLEDLFPTVLALVGVPSSEVPETDGRDQSARLRRTAAEPEDPERVLLAESGSAMLLGAAVATFEGHRENKRCAHGPRFSLCTFPETGAKLYDRETDPNFRTDVSAEHSEDAAVLAAALERWPVREARERSARDRRFKLVERPRLEGGFERTLYDLDADPAEAVDVTAQHPKAAARLGAALDAWTASLPAAAPEAERDPEQLELLRALGYVD